MSASESLGLIIYNSQNYKIYCSRKDLTNMKNESDYCEPTLYFELHTILEFDNRYYVPSAIKIRKDSHRQHRSRSKKIFERRSLSFL